MATGPLRFRTPHIEELPITQTKQAPGFAWVPVAGPLEDPSKNWGADNRKRARAAAGGQTEAQKEALSARQQREVERKIRELNSDNSKDVQIPLPKKDTGGPSRLGKTATTKKILASGKTLVHYLADEEAEIAKTGKRDGDLEVAPPLLQWPSNTALGRLKGKDDGSGNSTPISSGHAASARDTPSRPTTPRETTFPEQTDANGEDESGINPLPTDAELEMLLNYPPLTYNQARSAPPPADTPPPRKFCEVCGFFGRAKCMKCGAMTCSVMCKDTHDEHRCMRFYA